MSEFVTLSSVKDSSNTLSGELTTTLRDAIITGEIAQGAKLSEAKLAKELDVSRGPLREAIRRSHPSTWCTSCYTQSRANFAAL